MNRRGSVILETGLALPVLALLLLGGVDFGRLFLLRQSVIGSAYAGVLAEDPEPAALAYDNAEAKQVKVERFTHNRRRYLRVTVAAEAQGLFGLAGKRVEASAVRRLTGEQP